MPRLSNPGARKTIWRAKLLAREVVELRREKVELLEENTRLKKGLDFLLERYFPPATCHCVQDEQ